MKHLKKFENFYLNDTDTPLEHSDMEDDVDLREVDPDENDSEEEDGESPSAPSMRSWMRKRNRHKQDEFPERRRTWGDEMDEKKKLDESELDESGLTAKQKKLPAGLKKAILARKKKSKK